VKADGAKVFTILRDGKEFDVPVTPGDIPIPAVTEKRLDDNIAYIDLKTFGQATTAEQFKKAIEKNVNADGFIIDLRQNPGGFFDEAIKAASLFVKDGTVVTVRERIPPQISATGNVTITPWVTPTDAISMPGAVPGAPLNIPPRFNYQRISYDLTSTNLNKVMTNEGTQEKNTEVTDRFPDLVDKPTVILVDAQSASSSEVFTGALKDHGDAYVVGTTTYGKGIGQKNFYNMPGGSTLRVTNFHFFNPSGHWPGDADRNRIGIMPDQVVPSQPGVERGSAQDLQLQAGISQINKMLGRAPNLVAPVVPASAVTPVESRP
jgi:C-terminal processing protease CtpA/Prc